MNTKKSKFQQKLDIAVRNMKKKHLPEDHRGSINDQVKLLNDQVKLHMMNTPMISVTETAQAMVLTNLIKAMEKRKTHYAQIFCDPTQYIQGIDDCINIVKRSLKKVSKDKEVNLHTK
jgi:hypothetical protein